MNRLVMSVVLAAIVFAATPAQAQSLGTYRWRLADFCSVVNVNVIQQGAFYQLVGYEEQCGGNPRLPVYGSAMLQADGTIWLGFTTIFPFGNGLHTQVTLNSSLSGFWRDNANQSGAFTLNPGPGPFLGGPRITPIEPIVGDASAARAETLESLQAAMAELQKRLAALAAKQ
jgi:hypothetical protein